MSSQQTLDVIFRGNHVGTIDKQWFGRNSQKYFNMLLRQDAPDRIDIQADVAAASVNEFVAICNNQAMNLTMNNILDLHLLFDDWQLTTLLDAANQYIDQHPELLPERITRSMSQGRSTEALEALLRQHFVRLCQDEASRAKLRNLGIHLLARVLASNNHELLCNHIHEVFPFLLSCLQDREIGGAASVLFDGVRMADLTDGEIAQLARERTLDFSVLPMPYFDLVQENRYLRRKVDEMSAQIQRLIDDVSQIKRGPVVTCDCPKSMAVVSCKQCHKTMRFVPDYIQGQHIRECRFSPSRPFDGIFAQMREKCGGNPHTHGLVTITSIGDARNHCWQVADPDWKDYYQTVNVQGAFIQIDFKSSKVLLEGYSILCLPDINSGRPLYWTIEISDDQRTWTVVDTRAYQSILDEAYGVRSDNNRPSRYVRFKQTNMSWETTYFFNLRRLELFGKVQENVQQ